jgi:hypothetical protein
MNTKLLKVSSVLAIAAGIVLLAGGIWGITFTYKNIVQEKIVTPDDASIPRTSVRGPLTLKAQVDVIRKHTLEATGGKTFAEMPRLISKLDEDGEPILKDGKPVLTANLARDIWIPSTTLTTALNLAILTYVFSGLIVLFGLISVWTGIIFYFLSQSKK